MEDLRLLLLMHCPLGLRLTPDEVRLVADSPEALSARDFIESLKIPAVTRLHAERPDWMDTARRILERARRAGVECVRFGDKDYPDLWYELSTPPPVFSFRGSPCWHYHPMLAVVGSRTPMVETRLWMQRELGRFLKANAFAIVSGGARGVDQWAHRLALDYQRPTVCVLPTGILNPYPLGQESLWQRIVDGGGCLLSTFALDEPLRKFAFHVRNRWIAGLARVCFIAEANRRSGSTLTAQLAVDEGRDVCTLPVFPLNDQGLANLDLIASGATMIRDYRDLGLLCSRPALFERANREGEEQNVH